MNTPPPEDPYKVLGVPKDATKDAIRSAHRKLVLQSHPDKVQDESLRAQKQDEFQRVQQAYEVLIDEIRRQQYDETVKRDELKRQSAEERAKASRRYETVRTSPREFDDRRSHSRAYEDGRPRSFEDTPSPSSRYDAFGARHPTRSFEGRKSSSRAEDDERVHTERERKRESDRSERRRARDRERDRERVRGRDDKYSRTTYYSEEDDLHHIPSPRESSKVHVESAPIFEDKYISAQEYIRRTSADIRHHAGGRLHKTYYPVVPPQAPPPPPITVDEPPPIRRSTARPRDRERKREPGRPASQGKESRIVDPPNRYPETRAKIIPPLATSVSSPPNMDIPSSGRSHHSHSRSSSGMASLKPQRTVEAVRRADGIPTLSRAHTSPMVSSTTRKDSASGKLKEKVIKTSLGEAGFDSGYSSSTPESPYLGGGRSPPTRYVPRASPKAGSFTGAPVCEEPDEYITAQPHSRPIVREDSRYERRSRSRSVSPVGRHTEGSSRSRAQPATPEYRPTYIYTADPSRISPVSPHIPVSYTPRYGKEDVMFTSYAPGRRATGSHSQPHYPRPYAPRTETIH
jgi:curved DNA-binding protein CbpA